MTSPALQSVERLRRVAALLAAIDDTDARWAAKRLESYVSEFPRGGERLDEVLGLTAAPGERSWPELERLNARDDLIAEIAARHFAGLEPPRAAKALSDEWRRYERHAHGADRRRGYSQAAPGSLRAMFFEAIALGDLPGERRIADVLRDSETRDRLRLCSRELV